MNTLRIVVLGSSYSSAAVFYYLEKLLTRTREPVDLLLIADKNYYCFEELLPQCLSDSCEIGAISQNFRDIGFIKAGVSYLEISVLDIDLNRKIIITPNGEISYQYLVLAPSYNLPDSDGNLFNLNTPLDVLKIKNNITKNLELAVVESNPEIKRKLLSVSIIGGNQKGIEVALSISDFTRSQIKKKYHELNESMFKVNVIEEHSVLLLSKDPFYNARFFYTVNKKKVTVLVNSKITEIEKDKIIINGEKEIPSGTIINCAMSRMPSLINKLPLKKDASGAANVDLYMKADSIEDVFAIGEFAKCIDLSDSTTKSLFVLNMEARLCANNVIAKINNNPLKPIKTNLLIDFHSLGCRDTLLVAQGLHFDGFIPWLFQRLFYICYMLQPCVKVRVFVNFIISLVGLNNQYLLTVQDKEKQKLKINKVKQY